MELKAINLNAQQDFSGKLMLTAQIDVESMTSFKLEFDNLKDKTLRIDITQWRNRRSLDANAYCWLLVGKLADALTAEAHGATAYTKDDIYLIELKKYGQTGVVKVPHASVDMFKKTWKYCEEHEKLTDENAVYFRFWVGSSNYDSEEMSLFLNGIVSDCNDLGIDTRTPEEVECMLSLMKNEGVT